MKTILIVDDDPDIRESVKEVMEVTGYKTVVAENGKDALKKLSKMKADLILLDIMMPEMDGWDTCAAIKTNKKTENVPVVFLTAKTDAMSKNMGSLGSDDYIEKPFDMDNLVSRVKKALSKKK